MGEERDLEIALDDESSGNELRRALLCPDLYTGALRTLTLMAFFLCAARSLALWVSTLQGCSDVQRDLHDPACLPSLTVMLCPGFLAAGCLLQAAVLCVGCTADPSDAAQTYCYASVCTCYWTPPIALDALGFFVITRFLADESHSPIAEVLSLWRLPLWEESLVLATLAALWIALFLCSALVFACFRILKTTPWPSFMGTYAAGCLLLEALLAAGSLRQGETFLPHILLLTSSISTGVLGIFSVGFIVYVSLELACADAAPQTRPPIGYGYLWG